MTTPIPNALREGLLLGKVAWITGGGSGLGRAMALRFAGLGATVSVSGRRPDPLTETVEMIRAAGGRASAERCDVRDFAAVEQAVRRIVHEHGTLDILVNNAAGNFLSPTEELSPNAFAAVVGIVLHGSFHCTQAAGRHWIAVGRPGTVLNILATYAWTGSAYVVPSACAKAGVLAMTRSLTVEWGARGIRLNAIAPGPIPTEGAFSRLFPDQKLVDRRRESIPAGRLGSPEEVAELAAFLVSDASSWMAGEVVTLDGGEWLAGAGEFNELRQLPRSFWDGLRRSREK